METDLDALRDDALRDELAALEAAEADVSALRRDGAFPDLSKRPAACEYPFVAHDYTWTVREGSLGGPVVMRNYVYGVPDKEPTEGQELYLSNGSGPWRIKLLEQVPGIPRSPYNILVVERIDG